MCAVWAPDNPMDHCSLQAPSVEMAVGPTLNCCDLPESRIMNRRHRKHRHGCGETPRDAGVEPTRSRRKRRDRVKNRVKTCEVTGMMAAGLNHDTSREDWTCLRCTFINNHSMSKCEMCNASKMIPPASSQLVFQGPPIAGDLSDDWPSLQDTIDSWTHAEISSVGSSWLDVSALEYVEDRSDDCIASGEANQTASDGKSGSWAAHVGLDLSTRSLPQARVGGIVVPLSWRRSASMKFPKRKQVTEVDDNENLELMELEHRRLFPRFKRGAQQRNARACAFQAASATIPTRLPGGANRVIQMSKEERMKAAFANIGVFAEYADAPGAEFLEHGEPNFAGVEATAVKNIFDRLEVVPGGCLNVISKVLLESSERMKLISELDAWCGFERDLKLPLTEVELGYIIGPKRVEELVAFLPQVDQIYLRRCTAHGKYIRFHVDEALWTMQVPLNDPQEYQGGRLVYATKNGQLSCPYRAAGTATLHDSSVLHGVTKLESGVRYSLYFLQLRPEFK